MAAGFAAAGLAVAFAAPEVAAADGEREAVAPTRPLTAPAAAGALPAAVMAAVVAVGAAATAGAAPTAGLAAAGAVGGAPATAVDPPVATGTQGAALAGFAAAAAAFFLPKRDFRPENCARALLAVFVAVEVAFAVRWPPTEFAAPAMVLTVFAADPPGPHGGRAVPPVANIWEAPLAATGAPAAPANRGRKPSA